jgi:hypothetical protein
LIALVAVPVLVLGAAGGVWLGETLGQSGQEQEDETEVHVAGECDYDPATGLPIPAPWCIPVAPCPTCTPPPLSSPPAANLGRLKPNPDAVLSSPPIHRVGEAKALGRSDCPEGWQALASDSTGVSVCFPSDAEVTGPRKGPSGWDEEVFIDIPLGYVIVHRLGESAGLPSIEKAEWSSVSFDGGEAERYEIRNSDGTPLDPGVSVQEQFGLLIMRGQFQWEINAFVSSRGVEPLSSDERVSIRTRLRQIVDTVDIP